MTQEEVAEDNKVVEELKKKYNLPDEALTEIAEKLSIVTPELPEKPTRQKGEGLFGGLEDDEYMRMQKMMGGGDVSLSSALLIMEYWDRKDRKQEERERRRDEEPAWAKRLGERVTAIETKVQGPPTTVSSATDTAAQKLYDDLKAQLKELKDDNKELLTKLEKQAEEAKDEAQRQLIESKINEVRGQMSAIQASIDGLKIPPVTSKDVVDQYIDSRDRLIKANILKEEKGAAVKSREEVRARGQDMVLKHVDEAATSVAKTFEDIKNSVILPRLRVESGLANTGGLTEKQREDYYKRLNLVQ